MRVRLGALLVGLALSGAGVNAAVAACAQADLAGTWDLYITTNATRDTDEDGVADEFLVSWAGCVLRLDADGVVQADTGCANAPGDRFTIDGGELVLRASCLARGQLFIVGTERAEQIVRATLTVDKGLLVGVGRTSSGGPFIFQAVKR